MADYYPVISRAVAGLDPNTGEARRKVYERARAAILRQLRSIEPPVAEEDIARERMQLEEAIRRVEAEAPGADAPAPDPAPQAPPSAAKPEPAPANAPAAAPRVEPAKGAAPAEGQGQGQAKGQGDARDAGKGKGKGAGNGNGKGAGNGNGKGGGKGGQARPATRADGRPIVQGQGGGGREPKRRSAPLVALGALAAIAVVAGLFAARGQIAELFSGAPGETARSGQEQADGAKPDDAKSGEVKSGEARTDDGKSDDRLPQQDQTAEAPPAASPAPAEPATPPAEPPAAETPPPADQQARAPDAAQPDAPAPEQPAGPLVAQRAVLYEEGPNQQSGEALQGSVVWRTESVSGGPNQPLDTALKGEIEIPGRNIRAVVTIRRNLDATLPASHTIEVQFILPPDFANAGVSNVPGVLMKTDESARGAAVSGLSVKVTNGFFLIGLSNIESERSVNEQLLRDRGWIDIPILYENGRRAVLTLDKGTPGKQAFDQAFDAWKSASATTPAP